VVRAQLIRRRDKKEAVAEMLAAEKEEYADRKAAAAPPRYLGTDG